MSRFWTPMPHFCGGRAIFARVRLGTAGLLCAFLLSACGESTPRGYAGSPTTHGSETLQPISAAPPNAHAAPPLPGTTGAPKTPDGLPALQAKGMNTALFSAKLGKEVDRIQRLENAVQELRNDFDAIAPAIVRLVSIEKDIQNLISQLEVLTQGGPSAYDVEPITESDFDAADAYRPVEIPPPPVSTPPAQDGVVGGEASPTASPAPLSLAQETAPLTPEAALPQTGPPPAATAPAQADTASTATVAARAGPVIRALRIGTHPGKLRLVLDASARTPYTAELDNAEKILVVELPEAGWNAETEKIFKDSPLLQGYRVEKSGERGTMLVIELKRQTNLTYKGVMDSPDGGSRIILDLSL